MYCDVVELREFYRTPLGRLAAESIAMALSAMWAEAKGERLAGLGYCVPWLDRFHPDTERTLALMPAQQGAVEWPMGEASATVLVHDEQLPLADSSLDRIVMIHLLEHSESPIDSLKEAWRVLAPGGKLFVVVPNRRGVFSRFEHTPFGTGRPFSRGQLSHLLRESQFAPTAWSDALHFPPSRRWLRFGMSRSMERLGRRFWPIFSGVIMVEATKRMYEGLPVRARQSRRVFVPALAPQGAAGATRKSPY
ncbi:MAG: methyltransferase domain-containing protein [Nitratireductor sp.]|nr:methyltransferase domain-containing protein [Nitratireductor sp.]